MYFSTEQTEKLETYVALLKKWQKSINLVSNTSLDEVWERHVLDSAQLADYIPQHSKLVDFGSGAGFPALVLAILRPDLDISLIESDERKCAFLRNVSRETHAKANIHTMRIEAFDATTSFDFITARAFAPLIKLLGYGRHFQTQNPKISYLLLKGENAEREILEANTEYKFECAIHQSKTHPSAKILHIENVSRETS